MEDELFAKWGGWIVTLDALLNELILHRYIYQEVRKMVLSNPRVAKANHFYEWLYYVHGIDMAVAIRKLTDPDDRAISVRSFLEAIKRNPNVLSRNRYKGKFLDEVYTDVEADRYLDKLLGVGRDWIDVAKIDEQIQELENKTSRIKAYVDKVIAHFDSPTARTSSAEILQDFSRCIRTGTARQPRAWMRPRATQIQVPNRRAVSRPIQQRAHCEKLIDCQLAMKNMAAGQSVDALQVGGRDYLATQYQIRKIGRILRQSIDHGIG